MKWIDDLLVELVNADVWAYHAGASSATEPAALTALALLAHNCDEAAGPVLDWLSVLQNEDGSLGVSRNESKPGWPTAVTVCAWQKAEQFPRYAGRFTESIEQSVRWILGMAGKSLDRDPALGHDSTLIGWPWVEGTHSWIEPTAWSVLALKATGHGDHPRTREAVRLLVDRLLSEGGCNYGNTSVLGQELRPHVQPTGITMMALAGEVILDTRLNLSLDYLTQAVNTTAAVASLSYATLGLAAHRPLPATSASSLERAGRRAMARDPATHKLALLALAATAASRPLDLAPSQGAAR